LEHGYLEMNENAVKAWEEAKIEYDEHLAGGGWRIQFPGGSVLAAFPDKETAEEVRRSAIKSLKKGDHDGKR